MLQLRRAEGREEVTHAGRIFILESRVWSVRFATRWGGLGWAYRAPVKVRSGLEMARIRDHLMGVRVMAVLLLAFAVVTVRRKP